jgi:NADH dehydrogenase FAD-containing subunit
MEIEGSSGQEDMVKKGNVVVVEEMRLNSVDNVYIEGDMQYLFFVWEELYGELVV